MKKTCNGKTNLPETIFSKAQVVGMPLYSNRTPPDELSFQIHQFVQEKDCEEQTWDFEVLINFSNLTSQIKLK